MTPSMDQIMAQLRLLLPTLGTVAVMLGLLTKDQVGQWTAIILTAAGPLMILGGMGWSLIANSKRSILTSAANMPEVEKIKLVPTQDAKALEEVTPNNVKVSS